MLNKRTLQTTTAAALFFGASLPTVRHAATTKTKLSTTLTSHMVTPTNSFQHMFTFGTADPIVTCLYHTFQTHVMCISTISTVMRFCTTFQTKSLITSPTCVARLQVNYSNIIDDDPSLWLFLLVFCLACLIWKSAVASLNNFCIRTWKPTFLTSSTI